MRLFPRKSTRRAAMLVEVLVTVVLVAMVGMGIIASLTYGASAQQKLVEDNGAARTATESLERLKRIPMHAITPSTAAVRVHDNATPDDTSDDVTGTVQVQLYRAQFDADGNLDLTEVNSIAPNERVLIMARATVSWRSAGRGQGNPHTLTMETLLAP